ncbi:MAG: LysR family transcriptional regulator [Alphaproteobacteria bacterium]|nr:LysR family transcriptional regulator [Alphaproteobacteria bacterium]
MPRRTKAEPRTASAAPSGASGLNLRHLEIFVGVATAGSMSAAAARLDLTQPAASQAVGALEKTLGVALFDRSVRPPGLTMAGRAALVHAAAIVERVHALRSATRADAAGPLPLLRVGMLDSFVATAGPMVIDRVRDLATEWTIVSGYADTRLSALAERKVDIVVSSDESPVPPDIVALPILSEPFMLVLPKSYRGPVDSMPELVARLDFVRYGREAHMRSPLEQYLGEQGVQPPRRFQFNTTDAVMRMVGGGFGWTIVTPMIFYKSIGPMDAVRAVPLPGRPMRRAVILAMRRGEHARIGTTIQTAAVAVLRDVVLPRIARLLPKFADEVTLPGTE